MKVVVIIPTYNEAENIRELLPILVTEFEKMPKYDWHVLVVDGNSPDGTGKVVNEFGQKYPFVHLLLEKEKAGLGAAYIYAFKHCMAEMHADVIIEMDADFQHNPETIAQFMEKIDEGADYVIGSRFTKGGSIPAEWALYRKILSVGGNLFSKVVLGIYSINDFTGGFCAIRIKGVIDQINLDEIKSQGFAYKLDLIYKVHKLGAKIVEVPIEFGIRDRGDSKMERTNTLDSLRVVLTIRYEENKDFIKFCAVGFVGLFVDLFASNLLRLTALAPENAASLAMLIAMTVTFTLNNFWSFKTRSARTAKNLVVKYVPYLAVSMVPLLFRKYFVRWVVTDFGDTLITYNIALFVAIGFGLVWNYIMYSRVIWRKNR